MYYQDKNGRFKVIEDIEDGYFRIMDTSLPGKNVTHKYVDINGNNENNITVNGK